MCVCALACEHVGDAGACVSRTSNESRAFKALAFGVFVAKRKKENNRTEQASRAERVRFHSGPMRALRLRRWPSEEEVNREIKVDMLLLCMDGRFD